ncbi:hypothetical protein ABBQ32_007073 [Trebouxia sp. C0010 RCD-2024]
MSSSAGQKACREGHACLATGRTPMSYVGGDTSDLAAHLPKLPHIVLLFRQLMSLHLATTSAPSSAYAAPLSRDGKVKVANSLGVAHQLHRGSSKEGVQLYAGNGKFDFVQIVGGDNNDEVWFGQLLLLFSYKTAWAENECAFVRWLTSAQRPAHAANVRLKPMRWSMISATGIRGKVSQTDIVPVKSIIGPCFMQPDPISDNIFYYNHWIGNTANDD